MLATFKDYLHGKGSKFQCRLDAEGYFALHFGMCKMAGKEAGFANNTTFRAFPHDVFDAPTAYRGATFDDYGLSVKELAKDGDAVIFKGSTPASGIPTIVQASGVIMTTYSPSEARVRIQKILDRYYAGLEELRASVKAPPTAAATAAAAVPAAMPRGEAETLLLRLIARTVRALHVGHFFSDGNGRLNIFVVLNKLLTDNGFSPVVLPYGPSVFGGLKPVDKLVEDIRQGMVLFQALLP
ncbi:hypothetical protein D7V93_06380 [Corallococcus llansteffanensis]|uniref:Fido domain-containing protein n=2 Tax=Corallococcus llansteffanensis TaxID=2316731 RepID=A0A3A8Q941_9BACT|nr:hypothetical protein D7V93_06380 [Corallococcus llansteffanensis]